MNSIERQWLPFLTSPSGGAALAPDTAKMSEVPNLIVQALASALGEVVDLQHPNDLPTWKWRVCRGVESQA